MEERLQLDFKKIKLRRIETEKENEYYQITYYFEHKRQKYFLQRTKDFLILRNEDGDWLLYNKLKNLNKHLEQLNILF